jgi:CBS domain-containing protein
MAPEDSGRPIELPVRSLEIFERDGRTVRALRVFCPSRYRSIDSSTCAVCPFVHTVSDTAVACAPPGVDADAEPAPDKPLFLGPDALALRTPAGAVCAAHSVAVRADVPMAHARSVLNHEPFVVVLTSDDRVRGVLSTAELSDELTALGEMADRTPTVPEYAPLIEAIELMLHSHVRMVPVVGEDRRFLGLVADLDVLRWAARYHTSPHAKVR